MKSSVASLTLLLLITLPSLAHATEADQTAVTINGYSAGPSPFISKLTLTVSNLAAIDRVQFSIPPKPGSVIRPLSATYTQDYLDSRGYVDPVAHQLIVPVFGLYDGYTNTVNLTYHFVDGSTRTASTTIATQAYSDPCGYKSAQVLQPRTTTTDLSYDYILVTSDCSTNSPTVIDTDGAMRWVGTAGVQHYVSTFYDNSIYLANSGVIRIELDGSVTRVDDLDTLGAVGLHHSMDRGKNGLIIDLDTPDWVESVNVEIDASGNILRKWVLGDIISQAMIAGGDDPTPFVRKAAGRYDFNAYEDWFHNNSVAYRKSDDSLIISSRENFVICLDYETNAIKWILGDPTKQWYQYPSLRKYALNVSDGSHAPIGQHAVSITADDDLLLFDNGQRSQNHSPYGASRNYSAPRKYALDLKAKTATEVWNYEDNQSTFAAFRSSVYEDAPLNYLVHYDLNAAQVGPSRVVGLTPAGAKVFDYKLPGAGFRSLPVHWENLSFSATDARLANISARANVQANDNVTITGFIVTGSGSRTIVVRGLGPSLQSGGQPLPGRLMDPLLELYDNNHNLVQVNDNHKTDPNAAAISQAGLAPNDDRESAMLAQLNPGAYTAILRSADNTTGIGLAEVYDLNGGSTSEVANLSARGVTSAGDDVLIGGLVVQGTTPKRILFRALGPELQGSGVSGALQDPILDLYDADGAKIASNDDWPNATNANDIQATGIPPKDNHESAILLPLSAGNYTFIARGKDAKAGVAVVEAYRLD